MSDLKRRVEEPLRHTVEKLVLGDKHYKNRKIMFSYSATGTELWITALEGDEILSVICITDDNVAAIHTFTINAALAEKEGNRDE